MSIPLTKCGWPQVVVYPVIVVTGMLVVALVWPVSAPMWALVAVVAWAVMVSRAFYRQVPPGDALLVATTGERVECLVGIADNVKAGITPLMRYAK